MTSVPFLDLARGHREVATEVEQALDRVFKRGVYILGVETEAFEHEWANFCGARAAAGVANGTDALTLALIASGVSGCHPRLSAHDEAPTSEVVIPPLTAPYTALAVLNAGCTPIFADIDPKTYTLDPQALEAVITSRTRAVVPVHLYGQTADMFGICEVAARHNLVVVEDAAQAHGAMFDGNSAGALTTAAIHSFYPTKNLGAYGDGGAVISNDEDLIARVKVLRQGGHHPALEGDAVGRNSRLDELQAAMLRVKLARLDEWNERRRDIAAHYNQTLAATGIEVPATRGDAASHVYHLYVVQHAARDLLRANLAARGIETLIHYPNLLHRLPLFRAAGQPSLPVAEQIAPRIFSLPLNPHLTSVEVKAVGDALRELAD